MPVITMKDVAREAHVSATTVARAIYNNGYISESKRQKILQVVDELGYVPNTLARGLKTQKSYTIGNIVPFSPVNFYFSQISEALSTEAEKLNYHVISAFSDGDRVAERKILEGLVSRSVDAIIFSAGMHVLPENIEWLLTRNIPVVMIERTQMIPGVDKVIIDNLEGSYCAVRHIIERNHKKIGFIGSQDEDDIELQRKEGYRRALKDAGLEVRPEWVVLFENYNNPQYGYEGAKQLLSCADPPTAIFASSDIYACGVMQFARQHGLSVPEDLSLVGFDNTLSKFLAPPVTTVEMPIQEIGKTAIRLVMERIQNNRSIGESICYSTYLVDRGTVKDLR